MVVENKTSPLLKELAAEAEHEASEYPEISLANVQLLYEQVAVPVRQSDKTLLCSAASRARPEQPGESSPSQAAPDERISSANVTAAVSVTVSPQDPD
jgi:hypothetical protein